MSDIINARLTYEGVARGAGALADELTRREAEMVTDRASFEAFLKEADAINTAFIDVTRPYLSEWERLIEARAKDRNGE